MRRGNLRKQRPIASLYAAVDKTLDSKDVRDR